MPKLVPKEDIETLRSSTEIILTSLLITQDNFSCPAMAPNKPGFAIKLHQLSLDTSINHSLLLHGDTMCIIHVSFSLQSLVTAIIIHLVLHLSLIG